MDWACKIPMRQPLRDGFMWDGATPGTSCQATIAPLLRDAERRHVRFARDGVLRRYAKVSRVLRVRGQILHWAMAGRASPCFTDPEVRGGKGVGKTERAHRHILSRPLTNPSHPAKGRDDLLNRGGKAKT